MHSMHFARQQAEGNANCEGSRETTAPVQLLVYLQAWLLGCEMCALHII